MQGNSKHLEALAPDDDQTYVEPACRSPRSVPRWAGSLPGAAA